MCIVFYFPYVCGSVVVTLLLIWSPMSTRSALPHYAHIQSQSFRMLTSLVEYRNWEFINTFACICILEYKMRYGDFAMCAYMCVCVPMWIYKCICANSCIRSALNSNYGHCVLFKNTSDYKLSDYIVLHLKLQCINVFHFSAFLFSRSDRNSLAHTWKLP